MAKPQKKKVKKRYVPEPPRRGKPGLKHPPRRRGPKVSTAPAGMVRLQKYLAEMGIASRRAIEEMVREGRIDVDRKTVTELPIFINPEETDIKVDGQRIRRKVVRHVYYLLNKAKGVVCTSNDPYGRPTVTDALGKLTQRVYCVGRLDADTTGVILLTNDGKLTQHLTHPSHETPKTYLATVSGRVDGDSLEKLRRGIFLDGRRTQTDALRVMQRGPTNTTLRITLHEGRNREVRRMLLRLGHKVRKLHRVAIGQLTDRGLGIGSSRELSKKEVQELGRLGKDSAKPAKPTKPAPKKESKP